MTGRGTLSERISQAQAEELAAKAAERALEAFLRRVTAPGR